MEGTARSVEDLEKIAKEYRGGRLTDEEKEEIAKQYRQHRLRLEFEGIA